MLKKIVCLLLTILSVCCILIGVGCSPSDNTSTKQDSEIENQPQGEGKYDIWSTYNTMRVVQDPALNINYEKQAAKITAECAKNEMESAQLFITTNDYMTIDYFELIPKNLTNEHGDVFTSDKAEVYVQRYVDIIEHSYLTNVPEYPLGWMPDGLIPMALSNQYGENVVSSNCNQGITVDFIVSKQTPTGKYTGDFALLINNEEISIPVELTVWDFALPEDSTCQSSTIIYDSQIMYGEMTTDKAEINAYYKEYYDALLRYKINATWVPYALESPTALVDSVLEYWDHPNFQTFALPHHTFISQDQNGWKGTYYEYYKQSMIQLAKKSTEDKILFDKMYFWNVDEPESGVWGAMDGLDYWVNLIVELKQDVEDTLIAEGFFNGKSQAFKEKLLKSLHDIQHICTIRFLDYREEANGDLTYVPGLYHYEEYYQQLSILKDAEKNGNGMWYYTTIGMQPPLPTQFIDDFMITGREMKWMQKSYNFEGWLYYMANGSSIQNAETVLSMNMNPYDNAYRWENGNVSNGDGYFLLPGARYESKSPIVTQRLLAYREGQDDLDMMNYLDSIYKEYNEYYSLPAETLTFNSVLGGLYDYMFCRLYSYRSDVALARNRRVIANAVINALTLNDKFAYTIDYSGNTATYSFYVADGYGIKVGDITLNGVTSGSGKVYTYNVDLLNNELLTSIEVTSLDASRTVNLYDINTRAVSVIGGDSISPSVSEGSQVIKTDEGFTFNIKSVDKGTTLSTMRFKPKISADLNENFKTIELDLENTKDTTVIMTLVLVGEDDSTVSSDISLTANTKYTVEVLNRLGEDTKIKSFEIVFENGDLVDGQVVLTSDRQVKLSGIRLK